MKEIKSKIKSFNLAESVITLGAIKHEKFVKSSIFKASDVFVTASSTETQGITVLEAQVNGLVCVGINARGTKDLIKNNYNGFLVNEGDKEDFVRKILALLSDKKLYSRMEKNTMKEIKKHSIKKVVDVWIKLYGDLVKNGK